MEKQFYCPFKKFKNLSPFEFTFREEGVCFYFSWINESKTSMLVSRSTAEIKKNWYFDKTSSFINSIRNKSKNYNLKYLMFKIAIFVPLPHVKPLRFTFIRAMVGSWSLYLIIFHVLFYCFDFVIKNYNCSKVSICTQIYSLSHSNCTKC